MIVAFEPAWQTVRSSPAFGLAVTLLAFRAGVRAHRAAGQHALINPVLVAVGLIVGFLLLTHVSYGDYFHGAQYVNFLLGPATVALAVPMYCNLHHIRRTARALIPAIVVGSMTSAASAALIAKSLGASPIVTRSLIVHSVTTPIAMSISEKIGGNASLTATFTLLTGIVAAVILTLVMTCLRIKDVRAHGLAAGTAGHGLATARVMTVSETASAFAGLAIGLNGVLTAVMAPVLALLLC
jgi:predicted murein hydrolase (TIGR00659 family)